jgi:molecular chaperone HscB
MHTAESQSVAAACWSCDALLPAGGKAFCGACGKVQPVTANVDYFVVFDLQRKLNIDRSALERSFYRLSRKLHPDVYARASAQEQQWSLERTSLLNDAYRTLKNPVSRTEYLLKLEGVNIESEKVDANGKKESRVPADLLEEVFELNMQLEEMRMHRKMGEDDPALRADLEKAKTQFDSQLAACDTDLQSFWTDWDATVSESVAAMDTNSIKEKMVALLDRRRYIGNLVRDVNEALGA